MATVIEMKPVAVILNDKELVRLLTYLGLYVFSMTVQPMWHSTIFGPYFVVGAIFSGIAALLIAMALLRKGYGLQDYLKPIHFQNLGKLC